MNGRPHIKIEKDRADKILFMVTCFFLAAVIIFNFWLWKVSPQIIPGHFDLSGKVNRYDDKSILFILPAIALFIFLLLNTLIRYPELYNYSQKITEENAAGYYRQGIKIMRILNLGIMLMFLAIEFEVCKGIKNNFLALHWWEFVPALLITIIAPIFIAKKFFPLKTDHEQQA